MIFKPNKLVKTVKYLSNKERPKILDIGAGNHSASVTKKWIAECEYHGVDLNKEYHNNENDFSLMDGFYEMDLTKLDFDIIPDNYFDAIIMAHIVEHLHNGDKVIEGLLKKLKKGGVIYIEYPCFKTTKFPSMRETLNFFDDDTHMRIYSVQELFNLLMKNDFKIQEGGTVRQWINILLTPIKCIVQPITIGYIKGGVLWDLLGFAEYVVATKK